MNTDKEKDIGKGIIGALVLEEQYSSRDLSFAEILLDETLIRGDIWVLKKALSHVGGLNSRLEAKRNYELLVRIAKEYRVLQTGREEAGTLSMGTELWVHLDPDPVMDGGEAAEAAFRTDCYMIGRYKAELLALGCFDDAVLGILSVGNKAITDYLEKMVAGTAEFYEIYDCTQPILIYIGSDLCYNVLDTFAKCLGSALEKRGQKVEYFDFSRQQVTELASYADRRFKAVIGVQTYMFSVKRENGGFVHDEIAAPKYHFVFDHPIWVKEHLKQVPQGLCVLTPDRNYAKFVEDIYGHPAKFLPPGGSSLVGNDTVCGQRNGDDGIASCDQGNGDGGIASCDQGNGDGGITSRDQRNGDGGITSRGQEDRDYGITLYSQENRDYGIAFLGSYGDGLTQHLRDIWDADRKRRHLLNRYILYMRRDLTETPEHAFKRALDYYGIAYSTEEFLDMFYRERWIIFWLANYYRNKVVKTLLDAGITLHVFGESWKKSPVWGHPGLISHEAALEGEALKVYARSKLSLNIMMWHKDGFTERIANAMLQKSVVVTDRTSYLEENFVNGQDLLMFDLGRLEELPEQIKGLLEDEERRKQIAASGYSKAVRQHTWDCRAGELLDMIG